MMADITRWYLLRHARARIAKGTIYGRMDVPAEAQDPALLSRIAAHLPEGALCITTGLRRSTGTARMLIAAGWRPGKELVEPRFREQDFGLWEGQSHAALAAKGEEEAEEETGDGAGYTDFWKDPARRHPPGGESFTDLLERAGAALEEVTAAHCGRDIVLIGHGGSVRAIFAAALCLPAGAALCLDIAPLSLTLADHVSGSGPLPPWRVRGVNLPPGHIPA